MTSSGAAHVIPDYGAKIASKAALESHIRQLAFELAPHGIRQFYKGWGHHTPALRKIPGNERLMEFAFNPQPIRPAHCARGRGRTSSPFWQAPAPADWLTGNVLGVDGGEEIVG